MSPLPHPRELELYATPAARDTASRHGSPSPASGVRRVGLAELFDVLRPPSDRHRLAPLERRLLVAGLMTDAARAPGGAVAWRAVVAQDAALAELRRAGITARHLEGRPMSAGLASARTLLEAYERTLARGGFIDDAEAEREVVYNASERPLPPPFHEVARVRVMPGVDLGGPGLDLLGALVSRGVEVTLVDAPLQPQGAAAALELLSRQRIEGRGHPGLRRASPATTAPGPLDDWRRALFGAAVVDAPAVRLVSAANGAEEARAVAAVLAEWRDEGCHPSEMAVVVGGDGRGAWRMVAELEARGVAATSRFARSLLETSAGRVLATVLSGYEAGHGADDIVLLWRWFGTDLETPADTVSRAGAASLLRSAGIRGAGVRGYAVALEELASRASMSTRRGHDAVRAPVLRRALDGLMLELDLLPREGAPTTMAAGLERLVQRVTARVREGADPRERGSTSELLVLETRAARDRGCDGLTAFAAEWCAAAAAAEAALPAWTWRRAEFVGWVTAQLAETRTARLGVRGGAVAVLGASGSVGAEFARVVVAGVRARGFPASAGDDGPLPEALRLELNALLGPRLAQCFVAYDGQAISADAERAATWWQVCSLAREALCLVSVRPGGADDEGEAWVVRETLRSLGRAAPEGAGLVVARRGVGVGHEALARAQRALASTAGARVTGAGLEVVRRHFAAAELKASRLDALGVCAFKYLGTAVLGLGTQDPPPLAAGPRDTGEVGHRAMARAIDAIRRRGGFALARRDPDATLDVVGRELEAGREQLVAGVSCHAWLRNAVADQAIAEALDRVRAELSADDDYEPRLLEVSFGLEAAVGGGDAGPRAPFAIAHPDGGEVVRVVGQIDRVDVSPAGQVRVIDYKRAAKGRSAEQHLQLPLYAAVAATELVADARAQSAQWVGLADGQVQEAELPAEPDELRRWLAATLWARIDALRAGEVRQQPSAQACRACDLAASCRAGDAPDVEDGGS